MIYALKVVLLLLLQLSASNAQPLPPPGSPMLVWSDDFDKNVLEPTVWNVREGPHPDNAMAVYEKAQVYVDMDSLDISATPHMGGMSATGLVDTASRFWFKYGMVTFRAWMPGSETGTVPRLSLVGENSEIRLTLLGNQQVESSLNYRVGRENLVETGTASFAADLTKDFHVYKVVWTPNYIATYVDGIRVLDTLITNLGAFQKPHYLMMELSVGMTAPTTPGTMMIDSVRVFNYDGLTELLGAEGVGASTVLGPSMMPSTAPSTPPSFLPSSGPSTAPSFMPSTYPSLIPSSLPSNMPITVVDPAVIGGAAGVVTSNKKGDREKKTKDGRRTAETTNQEVPPRRGGPRGV